MAFKYLYMKKLIILLLLGVATLSFKGQNEPKGLQVNDTAPKFVSLDQSGNTISIEDKLKSGSIVIVFYRGEWCGYCNKQLKAIEDSLSFITKKGAHVIAVSPETKTNIAKTISKTHASYPVLSDDSLKILKAYKVNFELDSKTTEKYKSYGIDLSKTNGSNGNALPIPAVYVINQEGKIAYRYFDKDYTKRLSIATLLKQL
jgi:peroxiredoxin